MRRRTSPTRSISGLALSAFLMLPFLATPEPAAALDIDPLDYYDIDYQIVFSDDEVEPGEQFSVSVSAEVRCVQDLPFGADQATVIVSGIARHALTGAEITLLDGFEVAVPDVPDWEGDSYSMEETFDLSFPTGAAAGTYDVVGKLDRVSIDGLNITGFIPGGYRSIPVGPVEVTTAEEEPPPPPPTQGVLSITVLGHEYSPRIDGDGVVSDEVSAVLIEGEVSLLLEDGTRCLDRSGDPLEYISLTNKSSPGPYANGVVLAAFSLHPNGATFSPALSLAIRYDEEELPADIGPDDLSIAYFEDGAWSPVPGSVDDDADAVSAEIGHFSTVGLIATTEAPSPASFSIEDLTVSPGAVAPMDDVYVTISVRNTGGTRGTYPLTVEVNDVPEYADELTLSPSSSQTVRLWMARSTPGRYTVSVGNESASFEVVGDGQSSGSGISTNQGDEQASQTAPAAGSAPVQEQEGMHPVYIALLVMAGVAFLALVILLLAGVL